MNRHLAHGIYYPPTDEQTLLLQEVEAYDHDLEGKDRFGLSTEELHLLARRRASCYQRLHSQNRKRADRALRLKR